LIAPIQFAVGEIEGGAVLCCPVCDTTKGGPGWFSGFVGGETLAQLAQRARAHLDEKHFGGADVPACGHDQSWWVAGPDGIACMVCGPSTLLRPPAAPA
jgi:hypothetical protein